MSVRTIFYAALVLTVIFICILTWLDPAAPSNREFKRSGSQDAVRENLSKWGSHGQTIARENLALDWLFIVIYGTMWISGALYLGPRADPKLHFPLLIVAAIGIAGALFDITENICLYIMLHGNRSPAAPLICRVVAPINMSLFIVAGICMIAGAIAAR